MTIGPVPNQGDFYHPRSSSNHFSMELDALHRLVARTPSGSRNANTDHNNNDIYAEKHLEICCDTGFKPHDLNMLVNGSQLTVYGHARGSMDSSSASSSDDEVDAPRGKRRCFGETFLLPENVDQQRIMCGLGSDGRLSINMPQLRFEAMKSSNEPYESASIRAGGGLW